VVHVAVGKEHGFDHVFPTFKITGVGDDEINTSTTYQTNFYDYAL
jgi:hypothetical protein